MNIAHTIALVFVAAAAPVFLAEGCREPSSPAAASRPSCDVIDEACEAYEDAPGRGKECHAMAESRTTGEAECARRKRECLAACPAPGSR